ncbi:MAG TPA: M42 family peptidase, partial [Chitinophagaceae bacterium]|nr:M42 family peptidase [Chitinophagaceae bacterium]
MAKAKRTPKKHTILTDESMKFFREYINNASPVGFETWGQKLWLQYVKPYVDEYYIDPYGTAVGVVN